MARRQSRIRLNPNSRVCQSLVAKNKHSRRADRGNRASTFYVPVGVRRVEVFKRDLLSIGFKAYADYLASTLWDNVRRDAFTRWGRQCKACGFSATQIHHARYSLDALRGDSTDALWPVCGNCHTLAHTRPGGIEAANEWIRRKWRDRKNRAARRSSL